MPRHQMLIASMGIHPIDNMQLGRLAAACEERGRWELLLTVAPPRLDEGTASSVNPIAMFYLAACAERGPAPDLLHRTAAS